MCLGIARRELFALCGGDFPRAMPLVWVVEQKIMNEESEDVAVVVGASGLYARRSYWFRTICIFLQIKKYEKE